VDEIHEKVQKYITKYIKVINQLLVLPVITNIKSDVANTLNKLQ